MTAIDRENVLIRLMAEYDAALAADSGNTSSTGFDESAADSDPQLANEWQGVKHCLDLLDRARKLGSSASQAPPAGATGTSINLRTAAQAEDRRIGRFRLKRELGRGGLGIVYLAHDPKLRRDVALKVPRFEALLDDSLRGRFVREAEAAARLNHTHVATLLEVGQDDTICYYTSEYCSGPTLAQWLRECQVVPVRVAVNIVAALADAVHHAHSRGVLHRDIKPSNVLMESRAAGAPTPADGCDFKPKLTDFGMAKLLERDEGETRSGALIGTVAYMSPEQAEGRVDLIDARTDVYGLGAILYELLTGEPPYGRAEEASALSRLLAGEPEFPRKRRPGLPRDVESVVLKCLARRPADRYATAHELLLDLNRVLAGEPTLARPLGVVERAWKWSRRRPALAASVAIAATCALVLLGVAGVYDARLRAAHVQLGATLDDSRALLYAADMSLANDAWQNGNYRSICDRLSRHDDSQDDWRTFAWRYFDDRCRRGQRELYRHQAKLNTLAYSPDGKWLVTGGAGIDIVLWDLRSSRVEGRLSGHTGDVNDLAVSPDSRFLASASDDGTIRVWSLDSLQCIRVLSGFTDVPIFGLDYSPDGTHLAAACEDTRVRVWETKEFALLHTYALHQAPVNCLRFLVDGRGLVSGSTDATTRVIDVATGNEISNLDNSKLEQGDVACLAVSPDGRRIANGTSGGVIRIWDAESGDLIHDLPKLAARPHALAFSQNGQYLASAHRSGAVVVWDATAGRCVHQLLGNSSAARDLAFAPNNRELATVCNDGVAKVFDLQYFDAIEGFVSKPNAISAIAFRPDGTQLAFADSSGIVWVIDSVTQQLITRIDTPFNGEDVSLAFSRQGAYLAIGSRSSNRLQVYAAATGKDLGSLEMPGHSICGLTFAQADDELIIAGEGELVVANWRRPADRRAIAGVIQPFAVEYLTRSKMIVVGERNGVSLWDLSTLQLVAKLAGPSQPLRRMAVSADERLLASGQVNGEILLWNLPGRKQMPSLVGHQGWVHGLAFSSDAATLATCGIDGTVRFWDMRTLQEVVQTDLRHGPNRSGTASVVRFSPRDETLAIGGTDFAGGMLGLVRPRPQTVQSQSSLGGNKGGDRNEFELWRNGERRKSRQLGQSLVVDGEPGESAPFVISEMGQLTVGGETMIGHRGQGGITLATGANAELTGDVVSGYSGGADGAIRLCSNSSLVGQRALLIGRRGNGELTIGSHSRVSSQHAVVAAFEGGYGTVVLDPFARWSIAKRLGIGERGTASVSIASGAQIDVAGDVEIGTFERSAGTVSVKGKDATLRARRLSVSDAGEATLELTDGGRVEIIVGNFSTYRGGLSQISVSGPESTLTCKESLDIGGHPRRGGGGNSTLTLSDLGTVNGGQVLRIWEQGTVLQQGGSLTADTLVLMPGCLYAHQSGAAKFTGKVTLSGTLRIDLNVLPNAQESEAEITVHVMDYGSRAGEFLVTECPPGFQSVPHYSEHGLDVVLSRTGQ